jgi:hypothetical protein
MSDDDAQHKAPRRRGAPRARGTVLLAVLALSAVAASAAASSALSRSNAPAPVTLQAQLQSEIDDMLAAGVPADSPKVRMLQESLDQLRSPDIGQPPRDPAGDVSGLLSRDPSAVQPQAGVEEAPDGLVGAGGGAPEWESGTVECEPIPGLLTAAEIAGALCVSVPQPDGTSRYLAIGADGVARTVLFGADGQVRRLPDTQVAAGLAPGTAVTPTPAGDLQLAPPGQQPTVVDVS